MILFWTPTWITAPSKMMDSRTRTPAWITTFLPTVTFGPSCQHQQRMKTFYQSSKTTSNRDHLLVPVSHRADFQAFFKHDDRICPNKHLISQTFPNLITILQPQNTMHKNLANRVKDLFAVQAAGCMICYRSWHSKTIKPVHFVNSLHTLPSRRLWFTN